AGPRPGPIAGLAPTPLRMDRMALVLLGIAIAALYWEVVRDLVRDWWDDPNYSHGFLVPAFSGYLVWQQRSQFAAAASGGWSRSSWMGLGLLVAGLAALLLGDL